MIYVLQIVFFIQDNLPLLPFIKNKKKNSFSHLSV